MPKYQDRILFLKAFTTELILNSKPEKGKETEKKDKYEIATPYLETEAVEKKETPTRLLPSIPSMLRKSLLKPIALRKPVLKPLTFPTTKPELTAGYKPSVISTGETRQIKEIKPAEIKPVAEKSAVLNLGKLDFLLRDRRVTLIECPGPGKLILARTAGKTAVTRVSLSQEEISGIIDIFSKQARIPIIEGLFKTAVGNLIITAVVSEVVGSRFIITKMTPQFMLEQAERK